MQYEIAGYEDVRRMITESREIEQFWLDKEKEHGSTLVIATPADYVRGYPARDLPVSGLLYIMRNGIYFENFPRESWFGALLRIKEEFTKIQLEFKRENIIGVSCHREKKDSQPSLLERLSLFFSVASRQFIVTYTDSECERNVIFNCVKNPPLLCDAYDSN